MKYTTRLKANIIRLNAKPESIIKDEILNQYQNGMLSCAAALKIAEKLKTPVGDVGEIAERMHYKFTDCQLGLFVGRPGKKHTLKKPTLKNIPNHSVLKAAIDNSLINGRLPCKKVFHIASELRVHKLKIIAECTIMKIKISDCQLGVF